ncbi:MAG TPA: Hsp20/alpha crystallin family protein [Acidimicrobiales bacterium]|jgi:HSP20 family protein|nr:Hsp20/alpha crystallin family protein [Acidimicrobiales bacterium]
MAMPVRNQAQRSDVTRWNPFADLERELFRNWGEWVPALADGFVPDADLEETEDAYVVEVELPGVNKDDVNISLSGRRLTVDGERKEKEREGILRRRARTVGRFHYEITLPGSVDEGGVSANLDDGVLTVRVPKATTERPRRIEVS